MTPQTSAYRPLRTADHSPASERFPPSPASSHTSGSTFNTPSLVGSGLPSPDTVDKPHDSLATSQARALDALQHAAKADALAKAAGVDVARKACFTRVFGLVASAIMFGVAVAATVASGGAAAPVLAVASYLLLQSAGDAWCALKCWQYEKAKLVDPTLKNPLPMGSGFVGNLLYAAARQWGQEDEAARVLARRGALVVAGVVVVLGVLAGAGAPTVAGGAIAKLVANTLQASLYPVEGFYPLLHKPSADDATRLAAAQAEAAVCACFEAACAEAGLHPDAAEAQWLQLELPQEPGDPATPAPVRKYLQSLVDRGHARAVSQARQEAADPSREASPYPNLAYAPGDDLGAENHALRLTARGLLMASAVRGLVLGSLAVQG